MIPYDIPKSLQRFGGFRIIFRGFLGLRSRKVENPSQLQNCNGVFCSSSHIFPPDLPIWML